MSSIPGQRTKIPHAMWQKNFFNSKWKKKITWNPDDAHLALEKVGLARICDWCKTRAPWWCSWVSGPSSLLTSLYSCSPCLSTFWSSALIVVYMMAQPHGLLHIDFQVPGEMEVFLHCFTHLIPFFFLKTIKCHVSGFPDGSVGKESACNAGDRGLIPECVWSLGGGHGNPL